MSYGLLVVLAFSINLIEPVDNFLSQVQVTLNFPMLTTSLGWETAAGPGRSINIFGHPGAILLYTCIISYIIYRRVGYIKKGALRPILGPGGQKRREFKPGNPRDGRIGFGHAA